LGKAANDSERGAIFDAQAANLRDQGIDLKDLIAADQARHLALNSDATLKSNLAMNDSNLASNVLEQAGLGIENKTNQGKLDYQVTEQTDLHAAAKQKLLESAASIVASNASAGASAASAEHSRAGTAALGDAKTEKVATEAGMAMLYKELTNPDNFIKDANGTPIGVDKKLAIKNTLASGVSMSNLIKGDTAYGLLTDEAAKAEAAKTVVANGEKRAFAQDEQNIKDVSKSNADAITATKNMLDTSNHWWTGNFGQDTEKLRGDAAITAAGAIRVKDPSGKEVGISPLAIAAAVEKHTHRGNWANGGDLDVEPFNETMKMEAAARQAGVPVEELITKLKKGLTTQQMMSGMR
jgi:hypothetical protein